MVGSDLMGVGRRFSVFLQALHRVCDDITLLHLVPREMILAAGPLDELSRSQSAFWGVPLRVLMEPRRTRQVTAWNHYGAGVLDARRQPRLFPYAGDELAEAVGRHLDAKPDLVFAHQLQGMLPILFSGRRPARLVFDMADVEHRLILRNAVSAPFSWGKPLPLLQVPMLIRLEKRAVAASGVTFVCSDGDGTHLRRLGFGDTVRVVPNALRVPEAPPGLVAAHSVLFLGDMRYPPNRFAAERMVTRIWPRILARCPDARLLIAGLGSDTLPAAAGAPAGVEFLGFVDDLDALYSSSRLVCCPITTGGGTRLKLVEAASYARPIVSTRIGAEGLDFPDGQAALLRDDDAGLAEACLDLLQDDRRCLALGGAARAIMQAAYDARMIEDQVATMIGQLG